MIRLRGLGLVLCVASMFATGCMSVTDRVEPSPQADKVAVYESVPPGPRQYRLVKRVWTESRRSMFTVPQYESVEVAASDLRNQAAALGGDAIMYFGCYRVDADSARESPRLVCNGNVIKYGP